MSLKIDVRVVTSWVGYFHCAARDCVVCRFGGVGVGGASHFTSGESRCALLWSSRCVSALSLFPFPPPRRLTPPHVSLFFFVCLFCSGSVTLGLGLVWSFEESSDLLLFFFLFFFFFFQPRVIKLLLPSTRRPSPVFPFFFRPKRLPSPTMGDIEAPDSNRPRQSVLLSILPTKEFATSRKGSLLIAEVVRNGQRNHRWDEPNLFLCCCFRLMRTEVKARCVPFIWLNMAAMVLRSFNAHLNNFSRLLRLSFGL